jgi:hypothetical protein
MHAVSLCWQIPPNPSSTSSTSSGSWHVEVFQQTSRSVSWNTHVEVFIIPARDHAPDESFEDDELLRSSFSCEDDTLTPCTGCSDEPTTVEALEPERDTVG